MNQRSFVERDLATAPQFGAPERRRRLPRSVRMLIAWRRMTRFFGGGRLFAAVVLVLGIMLASAVVVYFVERGRNPEVAGIGDGFRWMVLSVLADDPFDVQTAWGKAAFYAVEIVKPGLMALITGAIVTRLIEIVLRQNAGLGRAKVKDHIIVCGWSAKGSEIVREIRGRGDDESVRPIVILAQLDENPSKDELTSFVNGDPANAEDLKRAGLEAARTAIILADNSYPGIDIEDMDSKTLLTALAVESINPNVYTCVEIIHSSSKEHFERTKADELLVSGKMTGAMLAHSAVTHGLTRILNELVSFPGGNEFYWVDVPASFDGLTYEDAMVRLKREVNAVPVAVSNGGAHYETNPSGTRPVKRGERLLVICEEQPKLA